MNRDQAPLGADLRRRLERFVRPGMPKYVALHDAIAAAVATGDWAPGLRLPTEMEWAQELPLSLGTIQRALRMLVEEGIIMRQQGSGTFVADRGDGSMHAPLHCRFVDDDGTGYLPVYPKIVDRYAAPDGQWTQHLRCMQALCIERVLSIGNEFSVYSRFYVDADRLPAFRDLPLKKLATLNFKELILRETSQPIGRIDQYLSVNKFEAPVCRSLGVRAGTVGQQLTIQAYVGRNSPIYYQVLAIPANNRVLHLISDGREQGPSFRADRLGAT
ncbi:GntR family transcriptional regulator [Bordetella petrii]|uniref:GntR family transcriptional regulator n=1 Tax=Bordetella petrii TaxID=94624 RepID=UPI001E56FF2A|nr:GntR family transcriptional regulator [Bordetella petrii]MCD0504650.1 GntR family transcriptional regulator [Bordetella petrii]